MTPYYNRDGITIYCGDCLKVMPELEPGFDAVIADLPYGTTNCSWDSVIPLDLLWDEYKKLIKTTGVIALNCSEPFTSMLISSNLKQFKYKWTWDKIKAANVLNGNKQPLRRVEDIAIFYSGQCVYNPQKTKNPKGIEARSLYQYKRANEFGLTTGLVKRGGVSENYEPDKLLPVDILSIAKPTNPIHSTQKPVALMSYLIRTYTNPGDLVLDNTAGSFTTGVACVKEGRRFVGIEKEEKYCQIGKERIIEAFLERGDVQASYDMTDTGKPGYQVGLPYTEPIEQEKQLSLI